MEAEAVAVRHSISCALGQSAGWRCVLGQREALPVEPGRGGDPARPGGLPIHGLLLFASAWQVTRLQADAAAAEVTSRLEFWKHPEWMAQFPFAHSIKMTHRLSGGIVEVRTTIENHSTDPMPLVIGFHPWYQMPDAPRDQWKVRLPVREHYVLSRKLIPTGKPSPWICQTRWRWREGNWMMCSAAWTPTANFGWKPTAESVRTVWPEIPHRDCLRAETREVVCFEPMTGLTNGFNLAHDGLFKNLQSIPPGATWTESFWIRPSGF